MKTVVALCAKAGVLYNIAIVNHNKMCYLEVICHHNKNFKQVAFEMVGGSQMLLKKTVEEVLQNNERNVIGV